MKVFYVIDENGEFYSEDRKVRYKELRGNELHDYLESDIGASIALGYPAEHKKMREYPTPIGLYYLYITALGK